MISKEERERAMNKSINNASSGTGSEGKKEPIVEQAKHAVTNVAGQAREQVTSQLTNQFDTRKDKAVETIGNVADAIRDTSDKLKGVGPLGDVAERAADGIERVAGFFEGKQVGDLVRDVNRFARREPAIFLGAAFAIGLIGGRFLKSSVRQGGDTSRGDYDRDRGGYDRYEASYGGSYGDGGYEEEYLSGDDLEDDVDSMRFASYGTQRGGRSTLPMGGSTVTTRSTSYGATQSSPSGGSYGATQGSPPGASITAGAPGSKTSQSSQSASSGATQGSGGSSASSASSGSSGASTPNGVAKSGVSSNDKPGSV